MAELYTWGPLLGEKLRPLPSLEPRCLAAIIYLRIIGKDFNVVACNNSAMSPKGQLPLMREDMQLYDGLHAIIARPGYNLQADSIHDISSDHPDLHLSVRQKADRTACIAMIEDKLYISMMYMWWLMPEYADITFARYKPFLSLPSRFNFAASQKRKTVQQLNQRRDWTTSREVKPTVYHDSSAASRATGSIKPSLLAIGNDIEVCTWNANEILSMVRGCYQTLATMLQDKPYIFGDSPTSLDAYIFGYLALHYYPILKSKAIANIQESLSTDQVVDTESNFLNTTTKLPAHPTSLAHKLVQLPTLSEILINEFPTLTQYLDRIHTTHLENMSVSITSPTQSFMQALFGGGGIESPTGIANSATSLSSQHSPTDISTTSVFSLLDRQQFSFSKLWRNDQFQTALSVVAGMALFVGYIWVVKGGEERRMVRTLEDIQHKQKTASRTQTPANTTDDNSSTASDEDEVVGYTLADELVEDMTEF